MKQLPVHPSNLFPFDPFFSPLHWATDIKAFIEVNCCLSQARLGPSRLQSRHIEDSKCKASWIAKTPPTLTVYSVSLTECKTHISILISVFPTAIWKEKINRIAIDSVDRIAKRNIYMTSKANGAIACYIMADFGSKGNFLQHTGASHWKSSLLIQLRVRTGNLISERLFPDLGWQNTKRHVPWKK